MRQHKRPTFSRQTRVAEQIRKELALMMVRVVKLPKFEWVTLTQVEVSRDYSLAKIYYTVLDVGLSIEDVQSGLESASGRLRTELGKCIRLHQTPRLSFIYDTSVERGAHLSALINEVTQEYEHDQVTKQDDDHPLA
jgi:ribosome-binding factor A